MLETKYYYAGKNLNARILKEIAEALYKNNSAELEIQEPGGMSIARTSEIGEYRQIFCEGKIAVLKGKTKNPGNLELKIKQYRFKQRTDDPDYEITVNSGRSKEKEKREKNFLSITEKKLGLK